jgi:CBS domain containing-hemolysin-like protein
VLGFIAEPTVAHVLEGPLEGVVGDQAARGVSIAVALVLVTVASMVVSELVPKNLAIARPVPTALALAGASTIYNTAFGPVIRLFNGAANWTVRRMGIEPQEELTSVRSLEELELLVAASGEEGTLDEDAFTLLTRSLRFGSKTAADALVPRFEVVSVRPEKTLADLVATSAGTGFSRFPVCRDDLDDVIGVVHVKDVARVAADERASTSVAQVMAEPFVVPETRALGGLLAELRQAGSHLAIVVDEYGGTAGIITLEDVLEEIVGEISDEYDPAPPRLSDVLPEGTYLLPGGLHLDEVREESALDIPDGEYETLAGFVLDRLGHIPEVGESFTHDGWQVEVGEMDRLRIATVKLQAPERRR